MAKSSNQKLKLLYLAKFFAELTDEEHGLTVQEMISLLADNDINADRKTIYLDIEELRHFGMDIVAEKKNRSFLYRLVSRDFELPELKLLVDSVQSAKFITERKSRELIGKLERLCSRYNAGQLQRQVVISGRVKTMNESIYYNVDKLHAAINSDSKITFKYFRWNMEKKQEVRRGGGLYTVSPMALAWDDEYYYLVAYEAESGIIKHFRVDKMLDIALIGEKREGGDVFGKTDLARYSKSLFGMYGGEETDVTLECVNDMAGTIIDRFGTGICLMPVDDEHFRTHVTVCASRQFLGWVIALGEGVRIVAPDAIVEEMKNEAKRLSRQYGC